MNKLVFTVSLIFSFSLLQANEINTIGYGEELEHAFTQEIPEEYSGSPAVILYHDAYISMEKGSPLTYSIEHYYRIKVLNNAGKEYGDVEIRKLSFRYHKIKNIRAASHSLENGEVITASLAIEDIYTIEESEMVDVIKFTLEDVKEGSIIEYAYSEELQQIGEFMPWYFDAGIPVLTAVASIDIHRSLSASPKVLGYRTFDEHTTNHKKNNVKDAVKSNDIK